MWVDAVKGAGLTPVVGVSVLRKQKDAATGSDVSIAPLPHRVFRARVWKLLREFPEVKAWGMDNEPDGELHGVSNKELDGVRYFVDGEQILRKCQRKGKCSKSVSVIAGEFSYQGDAKALPFWKGYGEAMRAEVKSKANPHGRLRSLPRLWAFHPYLDTTDGTTHGTKEFTSFLADLEQAEKMPKGALRVWLTETGTLLEHGKVKCGIDGTNPNNHPELQYKGARAVFALAANSRVDRIFWWQGIQAGPAWPGIWDTAFADSNGVPRASFCALTKQPQSACTGVPYSRHCAP